MENKTEMLIFSECHESMNSCCTDRFNVCVCVCMYVCVYVWVWVCVCVCVYVCVCVSVVKVEIMDSSEIIIW